MATTPLVSVVTPVYNGERYLAEAIESVLAQTYPHWEYVIVDNASTDRTGAVAQRYAARDARIRVVTNAATVGVIENHNLAFAEISPAATYVKPLHADDWLFPECLARMVDAAERHPSVGLVSAYALVNGWVDLDGLPYPSTRVPGRQLARLCLIGGPYVFGSPSSILLRADVVRRRQPFFDPGSIHADEAACYEVLQDADFGFVHQVLTATRKHARTVSASFADRVNSYLAGNLRILKRYGPAFLSQAEYRRRLDQRMDEYYRFLARRFLTGCGRDVWDYHVRALASLGCPLSGTRLATAIVTDLVRLLASPGPIVARLAARLRRSGAPSGDTALVDENRAQWRQKDAERVAVERVLPKSGA
ncbi:MAG: glycosyltransferase family 2 protein [Candidatus Rokubacteria bacterium]|nr:glycosyltransferase family 2 protein [Candidatus Rokubacteria bacterium]